MLEKEAYQREMQILEKKLSDMQIIIENKETVILIYINQLN